MISHSLHHTVAIRICDNVRGIQEIEPDLMVIVVVGKVVRCIRGGRVEVVCDCHRGLRHNDLRRHQTKCHKQRGDNKT